jgi:hypothetical protein
MSPDDRTIFHNKDDTGSYVAPALGLLTQGAYVNHGQPEVLRSPGYPLFLVPGLWLGEMELVTIGLQILLNCAAVYLVYLIAVLIFETPLAGICAAALYAIDPSTLIQTSIIQTETLFAFTLTLFVFLIARYLETAAVRDLVCAALVSAMCTYIKPLAFYMPFAVSVFFLVALLMKKGWPHVKVRHVLVFLIIAMAPVMAWQARNKAVTGSFVFSTIGGKDLYYDMACAILAKKAGISFHDQKAEMGYNDPEKYFAQRPEQRGWSHAQIVDFQQKEAIKIILTHPVLFLTNVVFRAGWTLVGIGLSDWLYVFNVKMQQIDKVLENRRDPLRLFKGSTVTLAASVGLLALLSLYWILFLTGLVCEKAYTRPEVIFLLLIVAYYVLLPAAAGIGYARFRHPIIPIMCVLAGKGFAFILERLKNRGRPSSPGVMLTDHL